MSTIGLLLFFSVLSLRSGALTVAAKGIRGLVFTREAATLLIQGFLWHGAIISPIQSVPLRSADTTRSSRITRRVGHRQIVVPTDAGWA